MHKYIENHRRANCTGKQARPSQAVNESFVLDSIQIMTHKNLVL